MLAAVVDLPTPPLPDATAMMCFTPGTPAFDVAAAARGPGVAGPGEPRPGDAGPRDARPGVAAPGEPGVRSAVSVARTPVTPGGLRTASSAAFRIGSAAPGF